MWTGISVFRRMRFLVLASAAFVSICGIALSNSPDSGEPRADIIKIDTLKIFGDLEKPEVVFLHDRHTEALEKLNRDCSACHLSENNFDVIPETMKSAAKRVGELSPKFKRLKDTSRKDVMNVYHDNCITCHGQMREDGQKTGPVICAGCHVEPSGIRSGWVSLDFDKSLHYRHVKNQEKKCERCHHEYDKDKQKLYYEKGKESSCRYCHEDVTIENRISMRLAAHVQCINCHRKTIASKEQAGPLKCEGCHAPGQQAKIEKVTDPPRMERNQPDYAIVGLELKTANDKPLTARMSVVPFNHLIHEQRTESCRICHHNALDPCIKCHTLQGSADGGGVKLERAMHAVRENQSCIGCHTVNQNARNCAGCHAPMVKGRMPEGACKQCHLKSGPDLVPGEVEKADMKAIAKSMLEARETAAALYPDEDIPEKVVIDELVDQYEAVEMPHRKIVKSLAGGIGDNKLAAYFHTDQGAICQGCHHNSPVSKKPPRCANCHGGRLSPESPYAPGLTGAYHQQCMGCHDVMELKKPEGCTSCHKEKTTVAEF